jgi:hypothetical protein
MHSALSLLLKISNTLEGMWSFIKQQIGQPCVIAAIPNLVLDVMSFFYLDVIRALEE